jgi:hypothetical protein
VPQRVELLKKAIETATDLTVLCDVVRGLIGDKNPEGARDRSERSGIGTDAGAIRTKLLYRVRALAFTSEIWSQARPSHLLWFWWGCELQGEVLDFTISAMETKAGLLGLLDAAIGMVTSSSEGTFERVNKDMWSKIVDIGRLTSKAEKLKMSSEERERDIAIRFLNAAARDSF